MKKTEQSSRRRMFYVIAFSLIFGIISGLLFTYICARFVPVVFTDWAGSFVCEGKMVFISAQRTFHCYTSPTKFYELGDAVFRTMFKIFVFPCIGFSTISMLALFALTDYFVDKE